MVWIGIKFFINLIVMDDLLRFLMDLIRSLEMLGYMFCRGDFDMVSYGMYC